MLVGIDFRAAGEVSHLPGYEIRLALMHVYRARIDLKESSAIRDGVHHIVLLRRPRVNPVIHELETDRVDRS